MIECIDTILSCQLDFCNRQCGCMPGIGFMEARIGGNGDRAAVRGRFGYLVKTTLVEILSSFCKARFAWDESVIQMSKAFQVENRNALGTSHLAPSARRIFCFARDMAWRLI